MSDSVASLIFQKWEASLKNRDKSKKNVSSNFDELFLDLSNAKVEFAEAHALLSKAIKAHEPNSGLIKTVYKKIKNDPKISKTEKEFEEEWKSSIKAAGTESFFTFFKIPEDSDPEDKADKQFGNMSDKEYRLQRNYADSFRRIDTTELERQFHEGKPLCEQDLLKILGDDNESN